jgi:hypothetical protein
MPNSSLLPFSTSHPSANSNKIRVVMPSNIHNRLDSNFCSSFNLPISMETKITLSIPSTISSKARVTRLMSESTVNKSVIDYPFEGYAVCVCKVLQIFLTIPGPS